MALVPSIALNSHVAIPQLGFGVWQVPAEGTEKAVRTALDAGYQSIDTAAAYRNEAGVGDAIRSSGLPRRELFITTKLANSDQGYDQALWAFDANLDRLGLEYLDLYLIHWPLPKRDEYVDTWRALMKLHADGRVRAILAVNQVELHPNLQQVSLREFHAERGIVTEAWSPLAQGTLLSDPTVKVLATKYGKAPAQIVLRWHLQLGNVAIPKSVTPSRIVENINVFDFELADDNMTGIGELDDGTGLGPDPDTFDFA
jgi:diketogulonate reductase-like aldo/keto reductase